MSSYSFLQARLSILEARIQQQASRSRVDQVRLGLLTRMKSSLIAEINAIEQGYDLAGNQNGSLVA